MLGMLPQCSDRNPVSSRSSQGSGYSWHLQNPLPTSNTLLDVEFIGPGEAFAVGGAATLLHTTDGGQSWQYSPSLGFTASSICFVDHWRGWAVGGGGRIAHTQDAGQTWSRQQSGTSSYLTAVTFVDEQNGWAVGISGTVLKTTDGGRWWTVLSGCESCDLNDVLFFDDRNGWAVGHNSGYSNGAELIRTTDGGLTWEHIDAGIPDDFDPDSPLPTFVRAEFRGIAAADRSTIAIVGEAQRGQGIGGVRLLSRNGGVDWEVELTGVPHYDVQFSSRTSGWIVGAGGIKFHSDDGGATWEEKGIAGGWSLFAVAFSSPRLGCAVGSTGELMVTSDGGDTWQRMMSGYRHWVEDILFTDGQNGWAATSGGVIRTVDGGRTWEETDCMAGSCLSFLNSQTGWACDFYGNLDKTSDGGLTWTRVRDAMQSRVYDMQFVDSLNGWAVGVPYYLRTKDGGHTWNVLGASGLYEAVSFVDSLNGWLTVGDGSILHTKDGGVTWNSQSTPATTAMADIVFIDTLRGWAVGGEGSIIATTDGGDNWELQPGAAANGVSLGSVVFTDSLSGWAVGNSSVVLHTVDGGSSWSRQSTPLSSPLYTVTAIDRTQAWAGGWGGAIIHTSNGGVDLTLQ